MKLHDALYGVTRLGFDTSPIIYFVEANPQYDARVTWVFQQVAGGALQGLTSVVTLSEVLVQPLMRGDIRIRLSGTFPRHRCSGSFPRDFGVMYSRGHGCAKFL